MLFFTVIIVIVNILPDDVYRATFYVSVIVTWFVALLSLIVLFVPKFWNIWKHRRKPWSEQIQPSVRHTQGYGFGIGFGGDNFDGTGGATVLGRVPRDFRVARVGASSALSDNQGVPSLTRSVSERQAGSGTLQMAAIGTAAFAEGSREPIAGTLNRESTQLENNPPRAWAGQKTPCKSPVKGPSTNTPDEQQRDAFSKSESTCDSGSGEIPGASFPIYRSTRNDMERAGLATTEVSEAGGVSDIPLDEDEILASLRMVPTVASNVAVLRPSNKMTSLTTACYPCASTCSWIRIW